MLRWTRRSGWLLLALVAAAGCKKAKGEGAAELRAALESALPCTYDTECVVLPAKCPLGCTVVANRSAAPELEKRLAAFDGGCEQRCPQLDEVAVCRNGRCAHRVRGVPGAPKRGPGPGPVKAPADE